MMADIKVKIQRIAIFSCNKSQDLFEKKTILTLEGLGKVNKELEKIFIRNIMGTAGFRGIWNIDVGKNSKIHSFSDQSILNIFRELLENDKIFERNATKLAYRYYDVEGSREAVILIFVIQVLSHRFVAIYSSEYLELNHFSDKEIIESHRNAFSPHLKKGMIYPYQAADGKLHYDKAKVYQEGSYAAYWLESFGLCKEPPERIIEKLEAEKKNELGPRIFLSHSSKDKEFVENLANKLKSDGFSVWYADWEIYVGDSIVQKINEGISSSDFLLVVLSNNSVNSKWVKEELNAATIRNIESKGAFVLPVLLEECEIPPLLADKKYANFSTNTEFAYRELVKAINFRSKRLKELEMTEHEYPEYSEIKIILELSERSVEKIISNLRGGYEEYHLSDIEKNDFLKEIRKIDSIALKAWDKKDYDTFQIAIKRLLWILAKIENWSVIEEIRIRLEEIGWTVVKDARATNIVLDSIGNILSDISENKRGYPLRELLRDYHDFSIYIIQEGLLISSNHSLKNYYQIGKEVLKKKNEELAVTVLRDFYEIFSKADYNRFPDKGNVLTTVASIGLECARLGFRGATEVFLHIIMSNIFFGYLLLPPFRTLEIVEDEARKQQWKEIVDLCQEIRYSIKKY